MSYYENSQWPAGGQSGWDHQTPPVRSGASSTVPREEAAAFVSQIEEVEKAIDNLVKSGKMFTIPGRRESLPAHLPHYPTGPARKPRPDFDNHNRMPSVPGPRPHSVGGFDDARGGPHPGSNLSNFYATQRHQSSRGSNEAEQMMQAKRRMAAQRERELRNYHQEQQYNRTVLSEMNNYNKPDRTLSPGSNMSEDERRELIARQRSALYGEGQFSEGGGYVDETGSVRPGLPTHHVAPSNAPSLRGHSPLAYEYGRAPPQNPADSQQQGQQQQQQQQQGPGAPEGSQAANIAASERSRANSNASPLSNAGSRPGFEAPPPQQQPQQPQGGAATSRTNSSSPAGSPSNAKAPSSGAAVAPIGTRPSGPGAGSPANPVLANKRSTTPLPSPLSHGYSASAGNADDKNGGAGASSGAAVGSSNGAQQSAGGPDSGNVGLSGWGGRPGVWGNKSGLGSVQASVWG